MGGYFEDLGFINTMAERYQLTPYWPQNVPIDERGRQMDRFEKVIYPIWNGIWAKSNGGETNLDLLHKSDLAIHKYTNEERKRPNRDYKAPADEAKRAMGATRIGRALGRGIGFGDQ